MGLRARRAAVGPQWFTVCTISRVDGR